MPPRASGDVAEIAVRFAGTTLEIRHVGAGGRYRIGTGRDVDLPVSGFTWFPLVEARGEDFVVRRPAGIVATQGGAVSQGDELVVTRGAPIELRFGLIVVTVTRIASPAVWIPRPRFEATTFAYVAGVLAVHLAIVVVALATARPERLEVHRRLVRLAPHVVQIVEPEPVRREEPKRAPSAAQANPKQPVGKRGGGDVQAMRAGQVQAARAQESTTGGDRLAAVGATVAELAASFDKIDVAGHLAQVGPLYRPDDVHPGSFGQVRAWVPTERAEFGSIPTGRYTTVATGKAAGEGYDPFKHDRVQVELGDGVATGSLERGAIEAVLARHEERLAGCYKRGATEVVLDFEIDARGKVHAVRGKGRSAGCLAHLVAAITFPSSAERTRVSYPMTFRAPH